MLQPTEGNANGNVRGVYVAIEFKGPDQPNKGLGCWICLYGNQTHVYKAMMKDMSDLGQNVEATYLLELKARKILQQRMIPKMV